MELQQRTDSWFRERAGKITASVAGTILGVNKYQTPLDLWRQCTGRDPPFGGNYCTQWGTRNELNGLLEYQLVTGLDTMQTGFHVHRDYYWLGASPDGLVGENGLVEIKCPMSKQPWTLKTIPPQYYVQIQVQMEVTNRDWCHLFAWRPTHQQIFAFQRNRQFFELIAPLLANFLKSMNSEEPPDELDENIKEHVLKCMQEDLMPWPKITPAFGFSEFPVSTDGADPQPSQRKRQRRNSLEEHRSPERLRNREQQDAKHRDAAADASSWDIPVQGGHEASGVPVHAQP